MGYASLLGLRGGEGVWGPTEGHRQPLPLKFDGKSFIEFVESIRCCVAPLSVDASTRALMSTVVEIAGCGCGV